MGYMEDTGNHDVRTEGMSYGMMVCVQMNRKKNLTVYGNGYGRICISRDGPGKIILPGLVLSMVQETRTDRHPDGEEYFAMALFLLQRDGGDGRHFSITAARQKSNLRECVHKGSQGIQGEPMWNPENHLIKFVTSFEFSDPSYHLPHFYEAVCVVGRSCDHEFWKKAADASRKYLHTACHFRTGLSAEYADYDWNTACTASGDFRPS